MTDQNLDAPSFCSSDAPCLDLDGYLDSRAASSCRRSRRLGCEISVSSKRKRCRQLRARREKRAEKEGRAHDGGDWEEDPSILVAAVLAVLALDEIEIIRLERQSTRTHTSQLR